MPGSKKEAKHFASATIELMFQPSLTRRGLLARAGPGLKGRAKFKPPLRGEDLRTPRFLNVDFWSKAEMKSTNLVLHNLTSLDILTVRNLHRRTVSRLEVHVTHCPIPRVID